MIELRPFARWDCERLLEWVDSPDALLQWAGTLFRWPLDGAQLDAYARTASDERLIFTAVDARSDEAVGHVELNLEREHARARIARVLVAPHARGRGVCTAMMRSLVRLAFDELGLHRLELHVFDFNDDAVACYERAGFRTEGHLRETAKASDGYWSAFVMGLLATHPRPPTAHTA